MATLKISDLSVGDWVICNGFKATIAGYNAESGSIQVLTKQKNKMWFGLDDIDPIPITAEILLKNGWENLRLGYKCSCGVYGIHILIKEASVVVTIYERERILKAVRMQVYSPDMSVHQLQHILRLAGVDKEINL